MPPPAGGHRLVGAKRSKADSNSVTSPSSPLLEQPPHGQQVRVPAPVLVDAEHHARRLGGARPRCAPAPRRARTACRTRPPGRARSPPAPAGCASPRASRWRRPRAPAAARSARLSKAGVPGWSCASSARRSGERVTTPGELDAGARRPAAGRGRRARRSRSRRVRCAPALPSWADRRASGRDGGRIRRRPAPARGPVPSRPAGPAGWAPRTWRRPWPAPPRPR